MARINTSASNTLTPPPFVAEPMHPDTMVPGGARVHAADFTAVNGRKHIPAGTVVGRTFAERTAKQGFGPVAYTLDAGGDTIDDDEVYITAFDVTDAAQLADVELLRHGVMLYEDRIPNWATLPAPVKAWVRANYQCIVSVDG